MYRCSVRSWKYHLDKWCITIYIQNHILNNQLDSPCETVQHRYRCTATILTICWKYQYNIFVDDMKNITTLLVASKGLVVYDCVWYTSLVWWLRFPLCLFIHINKLIFLQYPNIQIAQSMNFWIDTVMRRSIKTKFLSRVPTYKRKRLTIGLYYIMVVNIFKVYPLLILYSVYYHFGGLIFIQA